MLNLGSLIALLLTVIAIGFGGTKLLKSTEKEMAELAVEAHKSGYVSIQDYHRRLTGGR